MNNRVKLPFYAKTSLLLLGLFAFISILFISQRILVPLIYATILSIVLSPLVDYFVSLQLNRILAIAISIISASVLFISIIILLSSQAMLFIESAPQLIRKFDQLLYHTEAWVATHYNISTIKIDAWIDETNAEMLSSCRSLIGQTLINMGSVLVVLILIPVYVFMLLFYQPLLIEFIHKLFSANKMGAVNEVLIATKRIIRSYLVGLLVEALIIAVLNSTSLLILGVDYAVLLGVIGAMLNVIPYIGGITAVALPVLIAFATKPPIYALLVIACYMLIQLVDNHFIIPKVVASKVQINALVSVIVVLAGGALWGIPGMLLSIPLTAIVKVIFDHVDGLKPWGFLLGNVVPDHPKYTKKVNPA